MKKKLLFLTTQINLDWELIMKTRHSFFITYVCLIFLSNPVLAESLFDDVSKDPNFKMTCDHLGGEISFQKTGDNLMVGEYSLGLVESDEEGKRYIYSQKQKSNYGMLDFKKRRWYYDYDRSVYQECW